MKIFKKLVLTIALIGGISSMNAQIAAGGGIGYNEGVSGPGLVVKAEIDVMDNISISPSLSYFAGSKIYGFSRNMFSVDANGHYKIEVMMDELDVYPLAGLNYSSYNYGDYRYGDVYDEYKVSGNSLGLNIGGGGRWKFADQLSAFAELKYVISDYSHAVFAGGVLYEF